MPLVFVFIGLLPFTELAMKPEVRDMPATLHRQFALARSACAWSSISASPILCFCSPVGKLFSALRGVQQWKGCEQRLSSFRVTLTALLLSEQAGALNVSKSPDNLSLKDLEVWPEGLQKNVQNTREEHTASSSASRVFLFSLFSIGSSIIDAVASFIPCA
jgi:hypothetical protein